MKDIEEKFALIFKYMGIPIEQIQMEASFVKDFEFVEFQFGYLVFYLESYFRITITESEHCELDTIGSTMNYVKSRLKGRANLKISRREIRRVEALKCIPRNNLKTLKVENPDHYLTDRFVLLSKPKCAVL